MNLANNHTFDFGIQGLQETVQALEHAGIITVGWGPNTKIASKPWLYECTIGSHIESLAIIAGFEHRKKYETEFQVYATENSSGVFMIDTEQIKTTIQDLKAVNPRIFVIVTPHWGQNYQWITLKQKQLAHAIIDAGADMIIGHGAHMLQEIEEYKGKWIVYSIGNSMFNSRGRYEKMGAPPYSLIAQLRMHESANACNISTKLYPLMTDNRKNGYQSYIVNNEDEFRKIINLLSHQTHLKVPFDAGQDEFGYFILLRCR